MSPRFVRQTYRLLKSLQHQNNSSQLPEHLLENCRFCASRYTLLERLPKNGIVCEVGTYKGDFAREIVRRTKPAELHLIDIDYTHFRDEGLQYKSIKRHKGLSQEKLSNFPDDFFDWIYIDADHLFDSVLADAKASAPKLRPGGLIIFNDFAHIDMNIGRYGVHRAVVQFAIDNNWPFVFFAYEKHALYDVALKKPVS